MVAAIPIGTHARAIYDTQQDQGTSMPFFSSESHSKPRPPPFGLSLSLQATSSPYQCILVTTPDHDIGSTDHYSELGTEGDLGKNDQLKSEMVLDSYGDQNSSIGDRDPHQEDLNGQLPWSPAATLSHNISTSGSRLDGPILAPQPPSHSSLLHVADSSSLPGPSLMSGLDGSHRQIISCNESASDPNCLEANADLYIMDESSQPVFRHVMGSMTYNESSVWIHEWADAIMIAMGGTGSLDAAQSRLGRVDTSGGSGFIEHHYRVDQGGDKSISYGTWPTANTIAITATTADDPIAIENDTSIGVDSPVVAGVRPILPESDRLFVMRDPSNRTRVRWDPLSPVSKLVLHMFGYHAYIVMVTAEMLLYFGACVSIMLAIVTMWVGPCSPDASSLMTGTITSSSMIGWSDAICVVAWPSTQMEIRVRALWVRVGLPLLVMPLLMTAPRMRRNSFGMFIGVGGSVIVMTIVVGLVAAVGVDMTDLAFAGGSSHHGELAHGPLPKVYGRMRNPLPLSRVISMSFGILTTLYIVCGACGYVVFGQDVLPLLPQSLLNSAGKYVLGVRTAIAMLLLSLLLKYTTVLNTFCSRIEQCLYDGSDRDAIRTNDDEGFTVSVREHWKSHLVMRVGISV
ncbi:hypothetical protein BSLG_004952 [Batrachochytrium salamandrivorans]|nr:hypothetical protein BSLG_004952 [Batrachochytrium salamandrivorans]